MRPHTTKLHAAGVSALKLTKLAFPAALAALMGCSSATPPKELQYARAGVQRAKTGPAMQFTPADVREADVALQRAEAAFDDDPNAPETRDLARVAQLRAAQAEANAGAIAATQRKEQAQRELTQVQAERLRMAEGTLRQVTQETEAERQKRMETEAKLRDALSKVAEVKDEARGTVITIPGDVLFKTAKWTVMPGARARLDRVAQELKGQDRHIVVVGHTDSQGGNSTFNQELSDKRAEAVKSYLTSRGLRSDQISTEGRGPSEPIADNNSVEGRAQNRRVEIVVEPEHQGGGGGRTNNPP